MGQNSLAICYEYGNGVTQNMKKAFELYQLAAVQRNPNGLCNIGRFYYYGKEVEKDMTKAYEYCKLAADMGNPTALKMMKTHFNQI